MEHLTDDELEEALALQAWMEKANDLELFVEKTSRSYSWAWFNREICRALKAFIREVEYCNSPVFIINLPPRAGKSHICAQRLPVWAMLNHDGWEVVLATYAADLSNRMSRVARDQVAKSKWVQEVWGTEVTRDSSAVGFWGLTNASSFRAVGVGGALTGQGFNVGIIDDSIKGPEQADSPLVRGRLIDWYDSVFLTRQAPMSGIINIQTRWHVEDLTSHMLKTAEEAGQTAVHVNYPAIALQDEPSRKEGEALHPERFPIDKLLAIKAKMSPRWWSALYNGNPTVAGGNLFQMSDFRYYDDLTLPLKFDRKITVADLRFGKKRDSGSFVVFACWGLKGDRRYLIDLVRYRWSYTETKREFKKFCEKHPDAKPRYVEKKANAEAMEDDLHTELAGIILWEPVGDKIQRAEWVIGDIQTGQVYLPMSAPWLKEFEEEVRQFPLGPQDDQVDTMTMALSILKEHETAVAKLRAITAGL